MSGQNEDSEGKKVKLQDKKLSDVTVNDIVKLLAWVGILFWVVLGGICLYFYLTG